MAQTWSGQPIDLKSNRAKNPGLLLLFLVSVGTIVFPAITSVGLGTDMPPIWAYKVFSCSPF
jgi:hypothetical protein